MTHDCLCDCGGLLSRDNVVEGGRHCRTELLLLAASVHLHVLRHCYCVVVPLLYVWRRRGEGWLRQLCW